MTADAAIDTELGVLKTGKEADVFLLRRAVPEDTPPARLAGAASSCLLAGRPVPSNVLADGDRLVVIDVPQIVDLAANPFGTDRLHRDCRTMAGWFTARGLEVDADELLARLLVAAW